MPEICDDGDQIDGDGCDADCSPSFVTAITTGGAHSCALLDTGLLRCWGSSEFGQLGYGDTSSVGDDEFPSDRGTVDLGGPVVQVVAGYNHTCARDADGGVRCWGQATYGQVGLGNMNDIGDDELPASSGLVDLEGEADTIVGGYFHTCALLDDGAVRCWGGGTDGQLGTGNNQHIGDDELPTSVPPLDLGPGITTQQLAAGFVHTCSLGDDGQVRCWGNGTSGQLGYGNTVTIGDDEPPSVGGVVDIGGTAVQIDAGGFHTCALLVGGDIRCWGRADQGQLGYGNITTIGDDEPPSAAGLIDLGGEPVRVELGFFHSCALLDDGDVRCWGFGGLGELGLGSPANVGDDELPSSTGAIDLGDPVVDLSTVNDHACALTSEGAVHCWGLGAGGRLGYGSEDNVGDNENVVVPGEVQVF